MPRQPRDDVKSVDANREQRESILARLAAFTSSLDEKADVDWRLVATVLSEARREWQKFAPVAQDVAVALQARFKAALGELGGRLDIEYQRNISAKMVQRVVEAIGIPDDRLWLDVGFGNGSLLMTAKEFGFDVFGIDLRKKLFHNVNRGKRGGTGVCALARRRRTVSSRDCARYSRPTQKIPGPAE